MTYAQVLALIGVNIIPNGNNEITADVLRPILEEMLLQPNILIGVLSNLNTSDQTNLVNAINSILSNNIPNRTALRPINTNGVDFNQSELLWVRDAVNQTALANGAFTCQLGEQMVFVASFSTLSDAFNATIEKRYYRLTTGDTVVNSLGTGDEPPLMADGTENLKVVLATSPLVIDLGDIGTGDVEDAFNSDPNQPFVISGDKFIQAVQNGDNKLWQWIGGTGSFGNSATLAEATDFVDLTDGGAPVSIGYIPLTGTEVGSPVTGMIEIGDDFIGFTQTSGDFTNNLWFQQDAGIGMEIIEEGISNTNINFNSYEFTIQSNTPLFQGFTAQNYFGANYTDNTYVQKKYVDDNFLPLPIEGTNGQVLTTDGAGVYTWENGGAGGLQSVTADDGGIDNTDPLNPVFQSSLFQKKSEKGAANGYTPLGSDQKVPAQYLPSEEQIKGKRISENVSGTKNIDLDTVSDFHYTMTADTAFTFTNTPTGTQVRRCKLRLTGEFAPSWTQAGLQVFGDDYDGTKWNDILVEMWLDGTIKGLLIFQQRETA